MEASDSFHDTQSRLLELLYNEAILSQVALGILFFLCLFLFGHAFYKQIRQRWYCVYFILLCAAVILWSGLSLLVHLGWVSQEPLATLSFVAILPIPALMCLHVRQQVSYKRQHPFFVILTILVPCLLALLCVRDLFWPDAFATLPLAAKTSLYRVVYCLYAAFCLVRSYLLCFNVLYQMPKQTRRSTYFNLVGISAAIFLVFYGFYLSDPLGDPIVIEGISAVLSEILLPLAPMIAAIIMFTSLYTALLEMPASEVIITSREFVVGSLSTAILVLSRSKKILDWNKEDWGGAYPFPKPRFKEPINVYRGRILERENHRISPHDENIIIVDHEGSEKYFYLTMQSAGNMKQVFGYILEISEVTSLYTLLRKFESIAYQDHLTNLYNRNAYLSFVDNVVRQENLPLLIFVGDVNGLKLLNDSHGHVYGDLLLVTVADIITQAQPKNAFAARIGGDEFVVLVAQGNKQIADTFVHDVITMCSAIHLDIIGSPSISWGYALMTSMDQSYNEVFSEADAIMYEYKKARHAFHSSGLVPDASQDTDFLQSYVTPLGMHAPQIEPTPPLLTSEPTEQAPDTAAEDPE